MDYKMISSLKSTPSVTILLGMENNEKSNKKYTIVLKNLINEAKKELKEAYQQFDYETLLTYLEDLENTVMPAFKEGTKAFFISNDFYREIELPFVVESQIFVGDRFSTKKLLRNENQINHYYVLTLGIDESRLFEYQHEKLLKEIKDNHFPVKNKGYWTADKLLKSMNYIQTSYKSEFFKLVDSELQYYINSTPHPIVLAGTKENIASFKLIANRNDLKIGEIHGNYASGKYDATKEVGEKSFEVVTDYMRKQTERLIEQLDFANSQGRLEQDLAVIYASSRKGKARKLFVNQDYYQEAVVRGLEVKIDHISSYDEGYTEDLINEIIYHVMRYGGEVVFVQAESLGEYGSIVLQTRY